MAILKIEGFDTETTLSRVFDTTYVLDFGGPATGISAEHARTPGGMGFRSGNEYAVATMSLPTPANTLIVGFAFYPTALPNTASRGGFFGMRDAGATQVGLVLLNDGGLLLNQTYGQTSNMTATTGSIRTNPGVIQAGQWCYVEIKITFGTAGSWEIRVNGQTVGTGTGNTRATANNYATSLYFGDYTGNSFGLVNYRIDDLYVLDGTGTTNNDFWGDTEIVTGTLTGDGYLVSSVPTGSANRWENVDEVPGNITDYNTLNAPGDIDAYTTNLQLSGSGNVRCVAIDLLASKTLAGTGSISAGVRSAGANGFGANLALTTTFARRTTILETDPATNAPWTIAAVNAGLQPLIRANA